MQRLALSKLDINKSVSLWSCRAGIHDLYEMWSPELGQLLCLDRVGFLSFLKCVIIFSLASLEDFCVSDCPSWNV